MSVIAFTKDVTLREGQLYKALPEQIQIDAKRSGRAEPVSAERIREMAASIRATGQSQPALCYTGEDGKLTLVYGGTRLRAVELANEQLRKEGKKGDDLIRLVFTWENLNPHEALLRAIQENHERQDVNEWDNVHNVLMLQVDGLSVEQIAERYHRMAKAGSKKEEALKWVNDRLKLAKLGGEGRKKLKSGELTVTSALALVRAVPNDHEKQERVMAAATTEVKGKPRVLAAGVVAVTGTGKTAEKARAQVKRVSAKKAEKVSKKAAAKAAKASKSKKAPAPAVPAKPPAKALSVLDAAHALALAVHKTKTDATPPAEAAMYAALDAYFEVAGGRPKADAA